MAISVNKQECIGCEACMAVCPVGAINMDEGKAEINQEECISCGACIGECPVSAITREEVVREVANNAGLDVCVFVEQLGRASRGERGLAIVWYMACVDV